MKDTDKFKFIGNIEGRDLMKSKADVIVCDGFTGNVVLKTLEAMYRMLVKRGLTDDFINRMNYENYGGTPLLGVNAPVILGHGISREVAFKNMILLSKHVYEVRLSDKIRNALRNNNVEKQ
jgi:glycerol-3-phosphate acyltransferase PlsX